MAAKQSAAMIEAKRLVTVEGFTPYKAALVAEITRSAIYMSKWYKDWKNEKPKGLQSPPAQ